MRCLSEGLLTVLCNPKLHYLFHKDLLMAHFLSWNNQLYINICIEETSVKRVLYFPLSKCYTCQVQTIQTVGHFRCNYGVIFSIRKKNNKKEFDLGFP